MMREAQPPIDPTVSAINQESDKVDMWSEKLKENPDSPYARAQLMQAMNEKQQLYDMYQGNVNPFQTIPTQTTTTTQQTISTQQTQTKMSDSDIMKEMMRLKALYEQQEFQEKVRERKLRQKKRRQKHPKTESPFEQERYFYTPPPPLFEDTKPPVTGVTGITGWDTPYTGPRTRSQVTPFQKARQRISKKIKEESL